MSKLTKKGNNLFCFLFFDIDKKYHLNCHPKNETPVNSGLRGFFVESGRLELPSKQAIQKLSTRLVFS